MTGHSIAVADGGDPHGEGTRQRVELPALAIFFFITSSSPRNRLTRVTRSTLLTLCLFASCQYRSVAIAAKKTTRILEIAGAVPGEGKRIEPPDSPLAKVAFGRFPGTD